MRYVFIEKLCTFIITESERGLIKIFVSYCSKNLARSLSVLRPASFITVDLNCVAATSSNGG